MKSTCESLSIIRRDFNIWLINRFLFSNLPFGVYNLHPALNKQVVPADNSDDKLHSVNQRFLYEDPDYEIQSSLKSKKLAPKSKQQRQKMTVRLRPRKVLCSNCKGICNEKNENVDVSKKRKLESDDDEKETESSRLQKKYLMGSMLIPKLSRLQPSEISSALKGATKSSNKASEKPIKNVKNSYCEDATPELTFVSVPDRESREDNETKNEQDTFNSMFSSARTLKICFGEGEGTVVKIPPLSGDFNEDSGVSCDMNKTPTKPESKAAKKALKRARKQAKKNSTSDKKSVTSPSSKRIGALSPRNNQSDCTTYILEKRHKHKVKHKKKYKSDKKRDENTTKGVDAASIDYFNNIKDHCMNQKVPISLRRLSSNSYEGRSENYVLDSGSDEWEGEMVPEFPANSFEGVGGKILTVSPGDIVWGKVVGFPWWPGRVLSITSASKAHVEWFASKTSSLMPCDSLSHFLADFNVSVYVLIL